ncbi:angiopoietin-related protein 3 [Callorhinchus milii]|uniref:Angiopoietin-related protein 4-like protein n=1 Tax=Callorhinchus milii TaxID=7868 RepID=V9KRY7_CALMI|nr:angiopoietin-related protein 3 [Callorhinchus milii]
MKTFYFAMMICFVNPACVLGGRLGNKSQGVQKAHFATSDDVNLIAYGLLQLGQALKHHVDGTRVEIDAIVEKLDVYNSSFIQLEGQARDLESGGEALKVKSQTLELQDQELHKISTDLRDKLTQLLQERQLFVSKVEALEGKLERMLGRKTGVNESGDPSLHRAAAEAHRLSADELLALVEEQQQQINEQSEQIQHLLGKVLNREAREHVKLRKKLKGNNSSADQQNPREAARADSDCQQIFRRGERTSGIYSIQPKGSQPFKTYCQMTPESGWTMIQRRIDGSEDFDRPWLDYKTGFGDLSGEFWLGLENFYQIARQGKYLLQIKLQDWKNNTSWIEYTFRLSGEDNGYTLQIGQMVTGDLPSAMSECKDVPFSTSDRDNDLHSAINCAQKHSGGWWFSACGEANLNGKYFSTRIARRPDRKKGILWKTWKSSYYSFKSTLLMVRPATSLN